MAICISSLCGVGNSCTRLPRLVPRLAMTSGGAPVQELPSAYKLVYLYCLPLRGRLGHVPALQNFSYQEDFL